MQSPSSRFHARPEQLRNQRAPSQQTRSRGQPGVRLASQPDNGGGGGGGSSLARPFPSFPTPSTLLLSPRPQLPFLLFPVYSTVPCHALRFPYIPRATPFFFFPFPFPLPLYLLCVTLVRPRSAHLPGVGANEGWTCPPTPCLLYLHLLAPWSVLMHASLVSHK